MSNTTETKKKSPNLSLRGKEGNYVIGVFEGRHESQNFKGTYSSLISVEETNGSTTLGSKENKKEVEISKGDTVFFNETRWVNKWFSDRVKGERIKLTYIGTQAPKTKGFKPTLMYDMEVLK